MTKAQKNAWIVEHIRILYEDEIRPERYHERKGISNHCARIPIWSGKFRFFIVI